MFYGFMPWSETGFTNFELCANPEAKICTFKECTVFIWQSFYLLALGRQKTKSGRNLVRNQTILDSNLNRFYSKSEPTNQPFHLLGVVNVLERCTFLNCTRVNKCSKQLLYSFSLYINIRNTFLSRRFIFLISYFSKVEGRDWMSVFSHPDYSLVT